ncbi:SIS domain-containing protein [Paenibacillus sp. BC26]|uniref:D-sedoheptulose-7-phosphate isomerase n=1 Tax=Paenibacillus sp. BC26 TaxID=1881032 RepID=UPI0008F29916|nr:SIS domain-containing protein [Paenibacillus sp. BC26]SFS65732.1 D-sedoheptulose 7-phosphate isomerase [Paenibacillus sp. BC26]
MQRNIQAMVDKYPELQVCAGETEQACQLLIGSFRNGGKLLVCGNGGSASDSEHIVGELMKGFMSKRPIPSEFRTTLNELFPDEGLYIADRLQGTLPAISLVSHTAFMTAFANDVSAETVFAQQVYGYGNKGDVLIGLSTSGNSPNVVRAVQVAKALGMHTIGMTGSDGGRLKSLCDVSIRVPYERTLDIQERHLPVYHAICLAIEEVFFGP